MMALEQQNISVITVNSDIDAPHLCYIGQNMEQSGQLATRMCALFLPEGGDIAVISSHTMRAVEQREQAFQQYLPCCCDNLRILQTLYIQENPEDARQKTAQLLGQYPTLHVLFITCGNVTDICQAIREKYRKLTVICYEKYPVIAELVTNNEIACTLNGSLSEQGRLAMRLLFEKLIYDKMPAQKIFYTKL